MPVVEINVGGSVFATTQETLERSEWFATLLSPRTPGVPVDRDRDGRLFVDRDPSAFRHVLSFLRSGVLTDEACEAGDHLLRQLADDADFFLLPALALKTRNRVRDTQAIFREERLEDFVGTKRDADMHVVAVYRKSIMMMKCKGCAFKFDKWRRKECRSCGGEDLQESRLEVEVRVCGKCDAEVNWTQKKNCTACGGRSRRFKEIIKKVPCLLCKECGTRVEKLRNLVCDNCADSDSDNEAKGFEESWEDVMCVLKKEAMGKGEGGSNHANGTGGKRKREDDVE